MIVQSPTLSRTHLHPQSDVVARSGWQICAPPDPDRCLVRRAGRALRINLSDSSSPHGEPARWDRLLAIGPRLITGLPSGILPPAAAWVGTSRPQRAGTLSGTGATVFDLYRDGRVVVTCWDCPSLLHLKCDGTIGLRSPVLADGSESCKVRPGERLLGLTAELLQVLSPQALLGLAEAACADDDACAVWERYTAAVRQAGAAGPGPCLVVATRARG